MALQYFKIIDVIQNGLCIGCGLCESVSEGLVSMEMNTQGSIRPINIDALTDQQHEVLLNSCPGIRVEIRSDTKPSATIQYDPVWGEYYRLQKAWSGNANIRFRAATGGVLTSLAIHLLEEKKINFVYHIGVNPSKPLRNHSNQSRTNQEVINNCSSRYGPTSPLDGFIQALEMQEPFAIIAKPCDLNTVHNLSKIDPRVNQYCRYRLAMVCGGQSKLTKSWQVLDEMGLAEDELTVFRYRGYGNPGKIRAETTDGRAREYEYNSFWEDESKWDIETRCKFCPDALGACADVAAADFWPGGFPVGEDAGFNSIITHTLQGEDLVNTAVNSRHLILGETLDIDEMNDSQPHQIRKKQVLLSRFKGLKACQITPIETLGYHLGVLNDQLPPEEQQSQMEGVIERVRQAKIRESFE